MFQDLTSIVLDIGTAKTRVGYGGDDAPKIISSSYVSRSLEMERQDQDKYIVGDKFLYTNKPDVEIESIFHKKGKEGYQYDYERMEAFVEHMLSQELKANLPDYSILLSEDVAAKPHQIKQTREKMADFLFERLNVANIYFLKAPVLSCFATGRSTALVLDSGQNFTRAVSVHDGFCLYKSAKCVPYGGKNLSQTILHHIEQKTEQKLELKYDLTEESYRPSFLEFHMNELMGDIKESLSVKRSQQNVETTVNAIEYELPDKTIISLDRHSIKYNLVSSEPENYNNYTYKGVSSMITDNINYCDVDIKKELYSNILLTGGNLLYGTLIEDILGKVNEFAPPNAKVKSVSVCSPNERKYLSWIGGSIVTSLSSFQSYWVGRQEWKQNGSSIIEKKCT